MVVRLQREQDAAVVVFRRVRSPGLYTTWMRCLVGYVLVRRRSEGNAVATWMQKRLLYYSLFGVVGSDNDCSWENVNTTFERTPEAAEALYASQSRNPHDLAHKTLSFMEHLNLLWPNLCGCAKILNSSTNSRERAHCSHISAHTMLNPGSSFAFAQ